MKKPPNDGRMEEALEMWRKGIPSRSIQVALSTKYGITWRQVRRYIRKAEQIMTKRQEEEAPALRAKARATLEAFLERALAAEDLKAQGVAVDRLCKMAGLLDNTVNIQGKLDVGVARTDEETAELLKVLRAKQDKPKSE